MINNLILLDLPTICGPQARLHQFLILANKSWNGSHRSHCCYARQGFTGRVMSRSSRRSEGTGEAVGKVEVVEDHEEEVVVAVQG